MPNPADRGRPLPQDRPGRSSIPTSPTRTGAPSPTSSPTTCRISSAGARRCAPACPGSIRPGWSGPPTRTTFSPSCRRRRHDRRELLVDRAALAAAPRLKIVQKFGTIAANIDQAACAERGVAVALLHRHVNVAVAEQCVALMLAMAKRISALDGLVERAALEAAGYQIRDAPPPISATPTSPASPASRRFTARPSASSAWARSAARSRDAPRRSA